MEVQKILDEIEQYIGEVSKNSIERFRNIVLKKLQISINEY